MSAETAAELSAEPYTHSRAETTAEPYTKITLMNGINKLTSVLSLPAELHVMILERLCPVDLYSAINALDVWRNIMEGNHKKIMIGVMFRAIDPETEADFVLALRLQEVWGLEGRKHPQRAKSRDILQEFEDGKLGSLQDMIHNGFHPTVMLNLYAHFDHFMALFISSATHDLPQITFRWELQENVKIGRWMTTISERIRLQRAFFRFEIISCLMQTYQSCIPNRKTPVARFIAKLHPWEVEELNCLVQFYTWLMQKVLDKVDDNFVNLINGKLSQLPVPGPVFSYQGLNGSIYNPQLPQFTIWQNWEFTATALNLHFFATGDRTQACFCIARCLISRGVLVMRKLMETHICTATEIIQAAYADSQFTYNMLQLLCSVYRKNSHPQPVVPIWAPRLFYVNEAVNNFNYGWLWAFAQTGIFPGVNLVCNYTLRNVGYVFWDKLRLQQYDFVRKVRPPFNRDKDFPPNYLRAKFIAYRPSVFNRLYHLPISRKFLRHCVEEMGFTGNYNGDTKWMNFRPAPDDHALLRRQVGLS